MSPILIIAVLAALAVGLLLGRLLFAPPKGAPGASPEAARAEAESILADAKARAESVTKEAELKAGENFLDREKKFEETTRLRRQETAKLEKTAKDQQLDAQRRLQQAKRLEEENAARAAELDQDGGKLRAEREKAQALIAERAAAIEKAAGMDREAAKAALRAEIEESHQAEFQRLVKRLEEEARVNGKREAARILAQAVEQATPRYAAESTTLLVRLPSPDLKGRIIGREGRNIRSFEMVTGVDVLIDDQPDAITLACFNPLRREIARLTLDKLVEDGRIHPARIEETFERVRREFDDHLLQTGKDAAFGLGLHDLKDRPLLLLGKLKYRHSDGQNVLAHTLEVAEIAGHMAKLLELNPAPLRRAALYHELGVVEESADDAHPQQLAAEIARRSGEAPAVVALIEALRDGAPANSADAHLLRAAERLSFARPGALREGLEHHLGRLETLETIARQFDGVTRAYALKSGKELVVLLDNAKINDQRALMLCEDLAARIHQEVRVDRGGLKIAVIRESRAIDYAT